jgi:hypothetical protein
MVTADGTRIEKRTLFKKIIEIVSNNPDDVECLMSQLTALSYPG